MVTLFRTTVATLGLVLLAGCSSAEPVDSPVSSPAPAPIEEPAPESTEPEATEEIVFVECDESERTAISQPISVQTEAFVAGDYEGAYQMATPSFRQAVPLTAFEDLIDTSYGPLLESTNLQFGSCLVERSTGVATIDARFSREGVEVFGLRYIVANTADGWRVEGASDLEVVGSGA